MAKQAQEGPPDMKVSVVVCTYNREKFLPDCLESLSRQTAAFDAFELVLVNNNSTDNTATIVLQFKKSHPNLEVNYVVENEQGLSFARNRGIREANNEIITYIDDDAVASPNFVESILAFFKHYPQACAVGGKVLARFEGDKPDWFNPYSASLFFSHYDEGDRLFQYGRKAYPIGCNMSFRGGSLIKIGGFNTELGRKGKGGVGAEEKDLFLRLYHEHCPCYYDPMQVVEHQIDRERGLRPYTRKLALGLGQTHRKMYCRDGFGMACLKISFLSIAKFFAAAGLGIGYFVVGKSAVARHLIWYRWMVLKGLFGFK